MPRISAHGARPVRARAGTIAVVRRRRRALIGPVVAATLALVAFGGVIALLNRAAGYRRAEATLANAGTDFQTANLSVVEATDPIVPLATIRRQLYAAEASATGALAGLRQTEPVPAITNVQALVARDFNDLNGLAGLLFADPGLLSGAHGQLGSLAGVGNSVGHEGYAAKAAMADGTRQYEQRASQAETEARIGTALALGLLLAAFLVFYLRWLRLLEATQRDARSDALTGLGNRRALLEALEHALPAAVEEHPLALTIYDLDGFKAYNDSFGHLAGDALLARFAQRLRDSVAPAGSAYRMGGDEFCCLTPLSPDALEAHIDQSRDALTETGPGFEIACSAGCVLLPREATTAEAALGLADQRMYERKAAVRSASPVPGADVLLEMLAQRDGALREHAREVADLAARTALAMSLPGDEVRRVQLAAELHDVGKTAIPDTILNKPSSLDAEEWAFIRDHTIIGERIVRAAPDLARVAELVRSSHERVDGNGYPDGLAGEAIPLGARIVAACDAFSAIVTSRPYQEARSLDEAIAELRRCAGTQFDPQVVDALCRIARVDDVEPLAA